MTFDRRAWIAAAIGLLGCAIGLWLSPRTMLASYLAIWVAVSAVPIGAIAVLLTAYLVRAGWTIDLHPLLSRAALTMPIVALLFAPVVLGLGHLYPWAAETAQLPDFRAAYLTPWFFALRSVIYFAVLTALAVWAARAYGDDAAMKRSASAGLIVWALVASFAGIDWLESIEPNFHSSVFGLLAVGFDLLAGLGFAIVALLLTHRIRRMSNSAYAGTLLSVLLLWAYLHAMQYIIIWAGNISEEVVWYIERLKGGWAVALWALYIGQFLVPFFALLSERVRTSTTALLWLGGATLALRLLESAVLILPPLDLIVPALLFDLPAAGLLIGGVAMLAWQGSERWSIARLVGTARAR